MLFYPVRVVDKVNGRLWAPEHITGRVLVNPKYPVRLLDPAARVLCDSGAFQDIDAGVRLLPWTALDRQLRYEEQLRWRTGDHDFAFEAVVIYDQMAGVDEAIVNGKKIKRRGTLETARAAVDETLRAAQYYASQRHRIAGALCFAGQGVTPDQYVDECVAPMAAMMRPGDWFAFGGFCIIGRQRSLLPVFYETYVRVLDLLIPHGITRFHLLGVTVADAVEFAAREALARGVVASTDGSAIEYASFVNGRQYVNGRQVASPWRKADKYVNYCPAELGVSNVTSYNTWAYDLGANERVITPQRNHDAAAD